MEHLYTYDHERQPNLQTMILAVHPKNPEPRHIARAAEILAAGGIIIYPTDTVYGIGCSVEDKNAIERIHYIKRQRDDKPFSFVCSDLTHISEYAHVSNPAFKIMKHLIPGPYTFILPAARMKQLPRILVSKRKTVGIRVPDSAITLSLVARLGHPILSTSVTSDDGEILHDPATIISTFQNVVDLIIDGGVLLSEPSTVLDLTGDEPRVVRSGAGDVSMLNI
ncbi:MAG TPA: L-threonylcarbamoyladenylate synthase [Bacteroidota bacterium]|nr:L-threonylcarbamoyladenylate synthase [Bacteroidota bacterium]